MKMEIVTKGDIVWARVSFPHKWWPGLVLTTDSLGVMVSFFNLNQKHPPTYFIESEVIPFRNNYKSIVGFQLQRVVNDSEEKEMFFQLLHSALKLLGQRNILRLKCPCHSPTQTGAVVTGYDLGSLWPSRLLDFVSQVAVSPWVDVLDFVDATRAVAQVHVFRDYCITNQKGNYLKQHNCLSFTQKKIDVLQSGILESEDNSHGLSHQLKRNLPSDGISSSVLVKEDDLESDKYQVDSYCQTQEMGRIHVATEACDPNLNGESLKDAAKEVFKLNTLNENRTNLSSKLSSKTSDSQSSLPANTDTELTVGLGRETHTGGKLYPLVLKKEVATYRCAKRRRLDQDADVSSPKLQDFMPRWIDGALASVDNIRNHQCLFLNQSHSMSGPPDKFISDIEKNEETRGKLGISEGTESGPETIPRQEDISFMYLSRETKSKLIDGIQNTDLSKDPNFNVQIPSQISGFEHIDKSQANNNEVDTEVEMTRCPPETFCIGVQLSSELECDNGSKSNKGNKEAKTLGVLGARTKERKNDHQSVSSHSEYNSSIKAKQSEELPTAEAPTFLLMKFPGSFNLPSKQELVKKFSLFGSVDLSKTKVRSFQGSAYVAFLSRTDAVAAYEYARRKKIFGSDAHVGFWLHPSKHSRVESNPQSLVSSPKQKIHKLKPCLKHSNQSSSENRKKYHKVRLLLPEDSPGKVKLGAEDHRTIITLLPLHSTKVDRDETLGLEGSQYHPSYQIRNTYRIPVHKWKTPPRFLLNLSWQVVAGDESNEVEAQYQRELKVSDAIYTCPSAVRRECDASLFIY